MKRCGMPLRPRSATGEDEQRMTGQAGLRGQGQGSDHQVAKAAHHARREIQVKPAPGRETDLTPGARWPLAGLGPAGKAQDQDRPDQAPLTRMHQDSQARQGNEGRRIHPAPFTPGMQHGHQAEKKGQEARQLAHAGSGPPGQEGRLERVV